MLTKIIRIQPDKDPQSWYQGMIRIRSDKDPQSLFQGMIWIRSDKDPQIWYTKLSGSGQIRVRKFGIQNYPDPVR